TTLRFYSLRSTMSVLASSSCQYQTVQLLRSQPPKKLSLPTLSLILTKRSGPIVLAKAMTFAATSSYGVFRYSMTCTVDLVFQNQKPDSTEDSYSTYSGNWNSLRAIFIKPPNKKYG